MIKVEGVSKVFHSHHGAAKPLERMDLHIDEGEFIALLGPSGCGKTTLLNIVAGLEMASTGRVLLKGQEIRGPGPDRVVMFQESALFPWLKVIENVEYGMKIAGLPKAERKEKAYHYLKMVHLTRFAKAYPHQLSGGMRQRAALARALAIDSDVLLMDEPFAALDSQTRSILHRELQEIWQNTGKTIVFVTHNVEEAVLLADRVLVMSANPGRVKREFDIKLARPRDPENLDLAMFCSQILRELKEEVEKVARAEFDSDWTLQKSGVLSGPDSNLGNGI